jgi:hypothetical protein
MTVGLVAGDSGVDLGVTEVRRITEAPCTLKSLSMTRSKCVGQYLVGRLVIFED